MKTVIVVYSNKVLTKTQISRAKKYSFNTPSEVEIGDLIDSPNYDTKMLVVKVLDRNYKYFNSSTGELSDNYNSTSQWEIRTLVIREEEEEVIYGSLVKTDKA